MASGGIGKGANARTGAGATGAAAQVTLLVLDACMLSVFPYCVDWKKFTVSARSFRALEKHSVVLGLNSKAHLDLLLVLPFLMTAAYVLCKLDN